MFELNALQILVKENNLKLQDVDPQDRKYIWFIINTLDLKQIPVFKIELVRGELLSLALEAKEEGIRLIDKLGVSKDEYCNQLIATNPKRPLLEYFALLSNNCFAFHFIFLAFSFLNFNQSLDTGISYAFIIQFFAWIPIIIFFGRIITNQAITSKKKKINLATFDYLPFGIIIYVALIGFFPGTKATCIPMMTSLALLFLIILNNINMYLCKKYWRKEATKYHYQQK